MTTDAVESIVTRIVQAIANAEIVPLTERLSFSESEAAALIGVEPYVLRDERRKGNITGRKIGRRIFYSRRSLETYVGGPQL